MSNEFDIEKAKAGEPVEVFFRGSSAWEPVHFVGMDQHAQSVFQRKRDGTMFPIMDRAILRMASKTVKVRYRVALLFGSKGTPWTDTANGPESEKRIADHPRFHEWLTDWQEVEIAQ